MGGRCPCAALSARPLPAGTGLSRFYPNRSFLSGPTFLFTPSLPVSFSLRCIFIPTALRVLTGGLLATGCSSPAAPTAEHAPAATSVAERAGQRADSLNGIPGHAFGEPLSAFPGLVLAPNQTPGSQKYTYPDGKGEPGWFGKRKKEAPASYFTFYVFADGKFVGFTAISFGEGRKALQEQALYLLGPGEKFATGTTWDGQRVLASYTLPTLEMGPANQLDVQSQAFVHGQATAQAALLKAENAQ